jgi:hypothetical protein
MRKLCECKPSTLALIVPVFFLIASLAIIYHTMRQPVESEPRSIIIAVCPECNGMGFDADNETCSLCHGMKALLVKPYREPK